MMKQKYLLIALAGAFVANAQAASVDFRGQYKTGSEKYESRILAAHELANGIGGSIEYTINNTSKSGEGLDQAHWDNTEFALWYRYKLNDTIAILPSVWYQNTKEKGDFYKVGLQSNWAFAPTWRLDARVRYEYKQQETKDLSKHLDQDSTTRTEIWLRKAVNSEIDAYYNFRWDYKLNDYQYADKSSNYIEHNIGASYKVNSTFKPYAEIGYLGEALDKNKQLEDDWRIRLGAVISF
jgi:opacity protein-like surface antigen